MVYIAIDDTYGPENVPASIYVTGRRRTHVAIAFADKDIDFIRLQINGCLQEISSLFPVAPLEFHFSDIYNRKGKWRSFESPKNLKLIEFFAYIYSTHRWKVFIQTIDDRTLNDHPELTSMPNLTGFDLSNRIDLSLQLLLLKIRLSYKKDQPPIRIFVDHGKGKPGQKIAPELNRAWKSEFLVTYESSIDEPLLQFADFMAFMINRQTYLSIKQN